MISGKRHFMKPFCSIFVAGVMFLALIFSLYDGIKALASEVHGFALSEMQVNISSQGRVATFQLYDTKAAREFYNQLPLTLELSNFRDAQWMFYPPEKLHVTEREAYHDGKKGELSYYAPWGDVFMLYKDFYANDEMHRLGVGISGIDGISLMSGNAVIEKNVPQDSGNTIMHIQVTSNDKTTVFKLNNSSAAKALYNQLPLTIEVEDYGSIEKIFYPPQKLDTSKTPSANAKAGTLAYYAPWGDVVMFYNTFGTAPGLYELGDVVSGGEYIQEMAGKIQIEQSSDQ